MAPKRSKTKATRLKTEPSKTGDPAIETSTVEGSTTSTPSYDQASSGGCSTMQSEPFHPDVPTDAAVIHPVTPAILDEAAHKAARMADEVAHHADHAAARVAADAAPVKDTDAGEAQAQQVHAQETPSQAAPVQQSSADTAQTVASDAAEGARSLSEDVAETARDGLSGAQQAATQALEMAGTAVERSGDVLAEAAEVAGGAATQAADAASRLASGAEARLSGAGDAVGRYNAAVLGMIRTNMAATGEFFAALVKAQSVPEAVAINADHLRRQFDTLTTQGRELAQLAQALAFDTLKLPAGTAHRDT